MPRALERGTIIPWHTLQRHVIHVDQDYYLVPCGHVLLPTCLFFEFSAMLRRFSQPVSLHKISLCFIRCSLFFKDEGNRKKFLESLGLRAVSASPRLVLIGEVGGSYEFFQIKKAWHKTPALGNCAVTTDKFPPLSIPTSVHFDHSHTQDNTYHK